MKNGRGISSLELSKYSQKMDSVSQSGGNGLTFPLHTLLPPPPQREIVAQLIVLMISE